MSKHKEVNEADFQVGPTDQGMVRFIITTDDRVINLDFSSDEAREIAEEVQAAASRADKVK